MPAHAEVAGIVEVDHPGGACRVVRFADERAHHRLVAVGLGHREATEMVEFTSEALAPFGHRPIAERRPAIDDHPGRLALGMRIDDPHRA